MTHATSQECKHAERIQTKDNDTKAHTIVCTTCHAVVHICFDLLDDEVEKSIEKVRTWGVYYSKTAVRRPSEGAMIQREVEDAISRLREAMLHSRIEKNKTLEAVAKILDERNEHRAARIVRDLKADVSVS